MKPRSWTEGPRRTLGESRYISTSWGRGNVPGCPGSRAGPECTVGFSGEGKVLWLDWVPGRRIQKVPKPSFSTVAGKKARDKN